MRSVRKPPRSPASRRCRGGLGCVECDRDLDVAGVDAGHDDGDAVSDSYQSVVAAVQVGAGRAVLVTDVELVILHRDFPLAPFGPVTVPAASDDGRRQAWSTTMSRSSSGVANHLDFHSSITPLRKLSQSLRKWIGLLASAGQCGRCNRCTCSGKAPVSGIAEPAPLPALIAPSCPGAAGVSPRHPIRLRPSHYCPSPRWSHP